MLTIYTIVLNGMPFIERHLEQFKALPFQWEWRICEGVTEPAGCTSHCKPVGDRWHKNGRSIDGTSEYLDSIACENVKVVRSECPYHGKIAMIEAAMEGCTADVVMEIDADEMWTAEQIAGIYQMMLPKSAGTSAQFHCNYYVGPKKKVTTRHGFASQWYEWFRAWRWGPGMAFVKHEPPTLNKPGQMIPREATEALGLVFDHFAYCTTEQVSFKEEFYGWPGFLANWTLLQNTTGPVKLSEYFGYVTPETIADDA